MTKAQQPLTFAQAIARVAGHLGYAEAGTIAGGAAERTVYSWADPDVDRTCSLAQGRDLDAAYVAAGGIGRPILEAFSAQLDAAIDTADACRRQLAEDVAVYASEAGEAISAAIALSVGNADPRTAHRALAEAEGAHNASGALLRRLKSFLPGMGSRAGMTGGIS